MSDKGSNRFLVRIGTFFLVVCCGFVLFVESSYLAASQGWLSTTSFTGEGGETARHFVGFVVAGVLGPSS